MHLPDMHLPEQRTADLLLHGGLVRTLDPAHPVAKAVAVRDGTILAVGDDHELRWLRGPRTATVDLAGATLTPGLVDGHLHPVLGLETTAGADLGGVRDLRGLRDRIAAERRRAGPGDWILGWNLDPNVFGEDPVTARVVDEAAGEVPAFLTFADAHSALAGSAALRLAGVDGPREFGQGASIACDPAGRPTGHLLEHEAMDLVRLVIPAEPEARRRARLRRLLREMAAAGLTGGHVMDGDGIELVGDLDAAGELPVRLRFAPWCMPGDGEPGWQELLRAQRQHGELWRVGGVKLFLDGTIDGGTAWLEEPDTRGASTRSFWPDPAEFSAAVRFFAAHGVPTATHAIGDAAVRHVLDTVAGLPDTGARHRVEHLETVPDGQLRRFAELGVVASMQPTHAHYSRADGGDNWSRRLGAPRAGRAWRCRDLADAGATLVLGSDWPIASFDPRRVLAGARLRRPAGSPEIEPVLPGQALTALMALAGMTTHAAEAAGESAVAGRIRPGRRADLTAFTVDPLRAPADELAEAPIALTVLNGQITHSTLSGNR
ncbi:amidohydrolase [Amycolatopsis anabasis]|uniref:amidohydrolase n=1 Tax=Amycolatopsis anabasis TaxID=1840409 RepID=UPI001FE331A2|nr:amidohydrolase [Amycolatopsis anabasis]